MTDVWDQETASLLEHWNAAVGKLPEGPLYHYTDFDGLQGIIQKHALRATYNRVLNDGSERLYGEKAISDALRRDFASGCRDSELIDSNVKEMCRPTFVTSFSGRGDLLSMWRAYAGHGGGYCLAFGYSGLADLCLEDPCRGEVVLGPIKVSYGESLSDSVKRLMNSIATLLKLQFDDASPLLEFVPMLGAMVKHEAFAEEGEWRMMVVDPRRRRMQFRAGNANVKPYVDLSRREKGGTTEKLLLLPLERVICGPTLRREDSPDEIIRWMLEKNGYKDVKVDVCNVPFRL